MHRRTLLQAGIAGTIAALSTTKAHAAPLPYTPPLVVCEGNSITDCRPDAQPWHEFAAAMPAIQAHTPAFVSTALRGQSCTNLHALFPQSIAPLLSAWQGQKVAFLWEGTNELAGRRGDVDATWAAHAAYCRDLRMAGAQVVLGTILPRSYDFGFDFEAARLAWNERARAEWQTCADALMDVAQDERLRPGPLFMDHSHPNSDGQRIIAGIAAASLLPLLTAIKPASVKPASCLALPFINR